MRSFICAIGALAAFTMVAGASAPLQAAPGGEALRLPHAAPAAEPVARRCWWRDGERHCRWYSRRYDTYRHYRGYRAYRPRSPDAYRTGSSRWWQEMDRQDRGGRRGR